MIFLRHPKPGAAAGLCYGRTDLDIGPEGPAEIEAALETTPRVARVIASPALRCRQLAEGLAARDRVELSFEPRLWELDMGRWDGLHWDKIPRAESEAWLADPWRCAAPGGETFAALHARVGAVLATVAADTVLVCHAGPIRAARMIFAGLSFAEAFAEMVPYAQPIRIRREGA